VLQSQGDVDARIKLFGSLIISAPEPEARVLVFSSSAARVCFVNELAEYFIEAGYAVIFLHRKFSLLPYSRHDSHTTNCFLDYLVEGPEGRVEGPFLALTLRLQRQ
jgi:hypothetical protein